MTTDQQTTRTPLEVSPTEDTMLARVISGVVFVYLLFALTRPFFSNLPWLVYQQDDFFYYLKVAQNIAHGHGSTFNQLVPTNGYHPLWEALLVLLSLVTSNGRAILAFQASVILISAMATYWLAIRLFLNSGLRLLTSVALAIFILVYALRMFSQGMEVNLTVPLALSLLLMVQRTSFWQRGFWQSCVLGLLMSAMILSRLDSILFAGIIGLALLLEPSIRRELRWVHFAGVTLGLLPVALYVLSNHIYFDTWLPVSGMAKQLKTTWWPSAAPWKSLRLNQPGYLSVFLPIPVALAIFPLIRKSLTAVQRATFAASLLFPFAYLALLSLRSDWPLWGWYLYCLRIALCVSFIVLCSWQPLGRKIQKNGTTYALLAAFLLSLFVWRWPAQDPTITAAAQDLAQFSETHPGIYAMGDRAGITGYLLSNPLVQTEGLTMDRPFLNQIRSQRPLRQVLADYNARYYVASLVSPTTACFHASEPAQAGPESPHMEDEFCGPPVATFVHGRVSTFVYDLVPSSGTSK